MIERKKEPVQRVIASVLAIVIFLVLTLSIMKQNYDPVLFFTACMASMTASILYEAYVRDIVFEDRGFM